MALTRRRTSLMTGTLIALLTLLAGQAALADGTETLGVPSIPIASGTAVVASGTGMFTQPAAININVPPGATVKQALLYWEGYFHGDWQAPDDTIVVGGTEVTGTLVGGPTRFFEEVDSVTFRADITSLGKVSPGLNTITVSGLEFGYNHPEYPVKNGNNGTGLVVIYEEAGDVDIQVRDGNDLAFANFTSPLDTTVPQTFTFAADTAGRTATLTLLASSVEMYVNAIDVTVNGVTTRHAQPFNDVDGPEWDTYLLDVDIPAGATSLTVQVLSDAEPWGYGEIPPPEEFPASLAWVGAFLAIPNPTPPPPSGCSLTPGYWKTHSEFGPAPYDDTWAQLSNGASTAFFDSGATWLEALDTPPKGNAYWILSRAYAAATLNGLNGTDTSVITATLAHAEVLLDTYDGNPYSMGYIKNGVRSDFVSTAEILDEYNNGDIGPGHCD